MDTAARTTKLRSPLRFTLRSLFVAITIGCLVLGLWVNRVRRQQAAVAALVAQGAVVLYDFEFDELGYHYAESSTPAWLIQLVGVDCFHRVEFVSLRGDAWELRRRGGLPQYPWPGFDGDPCLILNGIGYLNSGSDGPRGTPAARDLTPLLSLPGLKQLDIAGCSATDLDLVAKLDSLEYLNARYNRITSIEPLRRLQSLETLYLSGTDVNDLSALSNLDQLVSLDIRATGVKDVSALAGLSRLRLLDLSETRVRDLSPLNGLSKLESIDLGTTPIDDVRPLSGLPNLVRLNLSETRVNELSSLTTCHKLTDVFLDDCPELTCSGLTSLCSVDRDLYLQIARCEQLDADDVAGLRQVANPNLVRVYSEFD